MTLPTYTSGILFTTAHKAVRKRIYAHLEKYNLSPSYWFILGATLHAPDGLRLSTIAKQMGVKAPLVTMLARDLLARDLIKSVPHHTDGRAKLLVITPKGRKQATKIEGELTAEIARLLKGLSQAEIASFQKALETIIQNTNS